MHGCGQALGQVLDTAHISVVDDLPGFTLLIDDFLQRHTQFLRKHPSRVRQSLSSSQVLAMCHEAH